MRTKREKGQCGEGRGITVLLFEMHEVEPRLSSRKAELSEAWAGKRASSGGRTQCAIFAFLILGAENRVGGLERN